MADQPQQSPGASELGSFGEELRREREIRGISLKEIADATKISRRFLDAIERNDHRTLPAPVFTRGFVREYARYLGLNADEMVNRYNFAAEHDDRIEKPPQIARYPTEPVRDISPKPPRKRGIPPVWARVNGNAIALLFLAAALAAVAWWAVQHRNGQTAEFFETTFSQSSKQSDPPPAATPAPVRRPAAPALQPVPVEEDKLRMTVEATANSWVSLDGDGKSILNMELTAGETRSFEANDQFRFRTIGNASGLTITVNGTRLPPLGAEGEVVRDHLIDRKSLEAVRGTAGTAVPPATS